MCTHTRQTADGKLALSHYLSGLETSRQLLVCDEFGLDRSLEGRLWAALNTQPFCVLSPEPFRPSIETRMRFIVLITAGLNDHRLSTLVHTPSWLHFSI